MTDPALAWGQSAATITTFGVACWLLFVSGPGKPPRAARAFALFLFAQSAVGLRNRIVPFFPDGFPNVFWEAWIQVSYFAALPAFVYFAVNYYNALRGTRALMVTTAFVLFVVASAVYFVDPCYARCTSAGKPIQYGFLELADYGFPIFSLMMGIFLIRDAVRTYRQRVGTFLVSSALLLGVIVDGALPFGVWASRGWENIAKDFSPLAIVQTGFALRVLAGVAAAGGIVVLIFASRPRRQELPKDTILPLRVAWLFPLACLAAFSGFLFGISGSPTYGQLVYPAAYLFALWKFAVPVVVCYAILTHRLFDIEPRKHAFVRAAPAGILVVVTLLTLAAILAPFVSGRLGNNGFVYSAAIMFGSGISFIFFNPGIANLPTGRRFVSTVVLTSCLVVVGILEFVLNGTVGSIVTGTGTAVLRFIPQFMDKMRIERLVDAPRLSTREVDRMTEDSRLARYQAFADLAWASNEATSEDVNKLDDLAADLKVSAEQKNAADKIARSRAKKTKSAPIPLRAEGVAESEP